MTSETVKLNEAAAQLQGIRQQVLATQQYLKAVLAGNACEPVRAELEALDNLIGNIFDDVEQVADLLSGGNGQVNS